MKELQRQASPNIVIALAGNKADIANKRAVELQVGKLISALLTMITMLMQRMPDIILHMLTGGTSVRRRQQSTLHGDLGQDRNECQRDFHGYW